MAGGATYAHSQFGVMVSESAGQQMAFAGEATAGR
jgi:hypothetical protein